MMMLEAEQNDKEISPQHFCRSFRSNLKLMQNPKMLRVKQPEDFCHRKTQIGQLVKQQYPKDSIHHQVQATLLRRQISQYHFAYGVKEVNQTLIFLSIARLNNTWINSKWLSLKNIIGDPTLRQVLNLKAKLTQPFQVPFAAMNSYQLDPAHPPAQRDFSDQLSGTELNVYSTQFLHMDVLYHMRLYKQLNWILNCVASSHHFFKS